MLSAIAIAIAITTASALIAFLAVWYDPNCRSPHLSVSLGDVVLLAG